MNVVPNTGMVDVATGVCGLYLKHTHKHKQTTQTNKTEFKEREGIQD